MSEEDKSGYVAPPSIGHEIGVMFGFIGAMLISMTVYAIWFNARNKKKVAKEENRRREVQARFGISEDEKARMNER